MKKITVISGTGVITTNTDENKMSFEFLPDNPQAQQIDVCHSGGTAHLMKRGEFSFNSSKKRVRDNSLLICKAPHGRLSGTRDKAYQLTLKVFAVEGIDWQRAFVRETVGLLTNLMGEQQMSDCLLDLIVRIKSYKGD